MFTFTALTIFPKTGSARCERRKSYLEFEAGPVGLHPYHCHVPPYARHVGKRMYGASMIVDPLEARPAGHEFVLSLCGFDVDGDGRNDVYTWNGMAGYYERFPLKVPAGDWFDLSDKHGRAGSDGLVSFHAQTFDLYDRARRSPLTGARTS